MGVLSIFFWNVIQINYRFCTQIENKICVHFGILFENKRKVMTVRKPFTQGIQLLSYFISFVLYELELLKRGNYVISIPLGEEWEITAGYLYLLGVANSYSCMPKITF